MTLEKKSILFDRTVITRASKSALLIATRLPLLTPPIRLPINPPGSKSPKLTPLGRKPGVR
jgi:hypothetical protein